MGTLNWVKLMTKHLSRICSGFCEGFVKKLERLLKEGIANWLCPMEKGICGRIAVTTRFGWEEKKMVLKGIASLY